MSNGHSYEVVLHSCIYVCSWNQIYII